MASQAQTSPFNARIYSPALGAETFHIEMPEGFGTQRANETTGEFEEFCSGARLIEDACEENQELAQAIANLLNRAYAMGKNAG